MPGSEGCQAVRGAGSEDISTMTFSNLAQVANLQKAVKAEQDTVDRTKKIAEVQIHVCICGWMSSMLCCVHWNACSM